MDPFAHTLVGGALAQTGLAKRTRFGTATLLIAANLPDIDGFAYVWGGDAGLYFRRGWTHGLLAMLVLPLILTGLILLAQACFGSDKPPPRARSLLLLSYLALATHPALDWLNTYGMRWLMPWSDRWFYGDALFIIDPWIWLLLGGAVFLSSSRTIGQATIWIVGIGLVTLMIGFALPASFWIAKVLWTLGWLIAFGIRIRFRRIHEAALRRIGAGALALATAYITLMLAVTLYARDHVADELAAQGMVVERLMIGPLPATPFVRDVVVETPTDYRHGTVELLPRLELRLESRRIPKLGPSPPIQEALRSPEIRGFVNWARFPFVEIEESERGITVHIMDARYRRARSRGFGSARVELRR